MKTLHSYFPTALQLRNLAATQASSCTTQQPRNPAAVQPSSHALTNLTAVFSYVEYKLLYSTYENTALIFCNSSAATQPFSHTT